MHRLAVVVVLALGVSGCALFGPSPEKQAAKIEPMLAAAGFRSIPADTPEKLAALKKLTPIRLTYSIRGGTPHYWYADPYRCQCIWLGDEARYQKYETLKVQSDIAQSQLATARMEEGAAQVDEQMAFFAPWGYEGIFVEP
ncbi:MAG: hypothetical protein KIT14_06710 [bacterium]|nr:hypothetical protein [bacterium]